ncbi:hypothetical protein FEK33_12650 [Nocardia asteroides NBRC 15531]|uniref:Mce-associated membrane protein n=1 Tax=Nocardia asteroides NBRC 15531 TaxID=1110697 RepID=U5ED39_NOCAS|nr:hypothetical protein [Nocardia asteroides]TLF66871.1 hypothetical protein FEK33_12650 [Nocardia asteroides NBRC 15531]UGT51881.1 hypothetical protein LT345_15550 [Nocardia asteroides]SFN03272.1 Mce-associated membrane protein [Nocardia asteroides]VEG35206.1 Uncharacterised protein [Nocardia asteroides]GAD85245.1 hypothetical protein NCAST_30_00150 [Nocardia asteroides NBRC 15531]
MSDEPTTEKPTAEAASEPAPGGWTQRLRAVNRRQLGLRGAVAILLGASLAASVFLFFEGQESKDLLTAQQQAREAACRYAPVLADYDSKNLDTYFAAVLDGATGDWKKQFDSTSTELREVLSQGEVVSKVTDTQCAIRTGDEESAEAIVVIGQTISSLGTEHKPKPGQLSMVLRLHNDDGRWLVEKVNSPLTTAPTP